VWWFGAVSDGLVLLCCGGVSWWWWPEVLWWVWVFVIELSWWWWAVVVGVLLLRLGVGVALLWVAAVVMVGCCFGFGGGQ
jgi:hypothetical protein